MDLGNVENAAFQAAVLVVILSGIPLGVSLVVGLVASVLQAATQIQEQTLTFLPKLISVGLVIYLLGPSLGGQLVEFTSSVLELLAFNSVSSA